MTQSRRYRTRQQKATQRRLQKARERLQREQARAQRYLQALEQAIRELGLPETVVEEVEWRLQAQVKRLLANPRSRALFDGFGAQWLGLAGLRARPSTPSNFRK